MKILKITNGTEVILDNKWFKILSKKSWTISNGYVVRQSGKQVNGKWRRTGGEIMHRIIAGAVKGEVIDHINRNPLDNRRCNLRKCSIAENIRNSRRQRSNNKSGYKGVRFHSRLKARPWSARIMLNYTEIHLGFFATAIEAAVAYDRGARKYHGRFASLNFP